MTLDPVIEPRKLPKQARSRVTRDAILEAATQLLRLKGLHGLNSNAVAERAGVSIGSFYQYFPNKDALMASLILREEEARLADLRALLQTLASKNLEGLIAGIAAALVKRESRHATFSHALDHEEARLPIAAKKAATEAEIDALLGNALSARLDITAIDMVRVAKSMRLMLQALSDGWLNEATPDVPRAQQEIEAALLGYLAHVIARREAR